MSELTTIKDLLEEEIKDLYSAEKQLTKAIPKMAKGSNNEELASAFEAHLKETENQVKRLERVAVLLGTEPTGKKCKGMEGVIEEGSEALDEDGDENVLDLGHHRCRLARRALRDRGLYDSHFARDTTW